MAIIGITMGCPAGIGPEILLRMFAGRLWTAAAEVVILGDIAILEQCGRDLSLPTNCIPWTPGEPVPCHGIPVLNLSQLPIENHVWGQPTVASSRAMASYITKAVALCRSGVLSAMVTCPISKSGLHDAGYHFPGHTEMLVELTGGSSYTMMMAGSSLRVTLATIHCALAEVASKLSRKKILELIQITDQALRVDFGISTPRLAVAGLNPHSGEDTLFGTEEQELIEPAVQLASRDGIVVEGPIPPDTVFFKAASGQFDAVVCMYHDQGLIPFKLLHFKDGVNVTLGLPIIRTSVDHGTAYDIAGRGCADETSLLAAVDLAAEIWHNRKSSDPAGKVP